MSDSSQLPTFSKQSVNGDRTSASTEPEVTVRQDGTVHLIYASYTAYFRDRTLLNAAKMSSDPVAGVPNRLTGLPTEIQFKIVKYLIPNRGRIAIGHDYYGPNTSGIRSGSLNLARVSKYLSDIALQVLYGSRWFRISASPGWHRHESAQTTVNDKTRWNLLRNSVDEAHPLMSSLDCFELLIFHTPAHKNLTRLEVMISESMGEVLIDGKLLKALQHAKGLRLLELFMGPRTPDMMPFVNELGHIRTIKVFSWSGNYVLYEAEMAKRNQNWELRQAAEKT